MKPVLYDYLGRYPEHIPTIADWHQNQWHDISPDLTTKLRISMYSDYASKPGVPCCIVALIGDKPAGSASLVISDMDTHRHLSPWLASVYVHPEYRNQGIATNLLKHCSNNAQLAGVKTLYLFTPDQSAFYLKRGWKLLESCDYHGENVDIMCFDLTTNT